MSINDPVKIEAYKDKWILIRGRETFYDEDRILRTFDSPLDAAAWAHVHLGVEGMTIPTGGNPNDQRGTTPSSPNQADRN